MIRAYDEYGNIVDLVEWKKQIRADTIDECIAKIIELNSDGYEVWWHTMCSILGQLKEVIK